MKKFIMKFFLILFLLSPFLLLKAAEPELRWGEDMLIYSGGVATNDWAAILGIVDGEAIDVDYFAGDTLRAVVACPDSTVRIFRSNNRGQDWSEVNSIVFTQDAVTEPHIVHGPDSTYHVLALSLQNQDRIYTRAYRTADDQVISGTQQYISGDDSVKSYSVCTDRVDNHDYSVFVAYQKGLGGRGQDYIYFTKTIDQGQNWSTPSFVRSGGSGVPDITYSNGVLYIVYLHRPTGNEDFIGLRRSLNFGGTWQGSVYIDTGDTLPKGGPQIAASYDGSADLWVIWPKNNIYSATQDWDLYWSRSQDSAKTWSAPAIVNSVTDSNDYFPSIAINDFNGSTGNAPYVSFVRVATVGGGIPSGVASVRSFNWESGNWNTATRSSDYNTSLTRPVQTFNYVTPVAPAIAYVGEGSNNVYFDTWEAGGIEEKDIDDGKITCSLDRNIITGTATLKYTLSTAGPVDISLFNLLGQKVATLFNGVKEAGENTLVLSSDGLSQGVYYLVIDAAGGTGTVKATIVK
jgi:hypothetical protein